MSLLTRENIEQGRGLDFLYSYFKKISIRGIKNRYKNLAPNQWMLVDIILDVIEYDPDDLCLVMNRIFNDFEYKNCFLIQNKNLGVYSDKVPVKKPLVIVPTAQFFGFSVWINSPSTSIEELWSDEANVEANVEQE